MKHELDILEVRRSSTLIGILYNSSPLSFAYARDLHPNERIPDIPYSDALISEASVLSFFENLLPEGDQRSILEAVHKSASVFMLLKAVGADCVGAYTVTPPGFDFQSQYTAIEWEELDKLIHASKASAKEIERIKKATQFDQSRNLSLSGAQHKLGIFLNQANIPHIARPGAPTSHIVKPDIVRADIKIFHSALNEYLVMKLASRAGLDCAPVVYRQEISSCVVVRFDREFQFDDSGRVVNIKKIHQSDFCQLMNLPSDKKYEKDGGPSLMDLWKGIENFSSTVLADKRKLIEWLSFNLLVGNYDSHAKNLSIQHQETKATLSPFYDLMSTKVYSGLGSEFALSVGGEFKAGKINRDCFAKEAEKLGCADRFLLGPFAKIKGRMDVELPSLTIDLKAELPKPLHAVIDKFCRAIKTQSNSMARRVLGN